jgi:hypothetical protein
MIKVKCDVDCYSVDGKETSPMNGSRPAMVVTNDVQHNDRVSLTFDGKVVTVLARDLQAAIQNATNRGGA